MIVSIYPWYNFKIIYLEWKKTVQMFVVSCGFCFFVKDLKTDQVTVKTMFLFQMNSVILTFLFIKKS